MDSHVLEYFKESSRGEASPGTYHKVIALHTETDLLYEELKELVPMLSKGWYELTRLDASDRIEFTQGFWLSKLPFHPKLSCFLTQFFQGLDDIAVFLTQKVYQQPFEMHMVYSVKDNGGFYRGSNAISEDELIDLAEQFPDVILPEDYTGFLQIHNGFSKQEDVGIVASYKIKALAEKIRLSLEEGSTLLSAKGLPVDPKGLIPFYESYEADTHQCFWDEWHPDQEMGNVYLSTIDRVISDTTSASKASETMAFSTFFDWLMFYLERVE